MITALATIGCVLWASAGRHTELRHGGVRLSLPLFLVVIVVADLLTIRFEFRRQVGGICLYEAAVVLSLAFCSPMVTLLGGVIGAAVTKLIQRRPLTRMAFHV